MMSAKKLGTLRGLVNTNSNNALVNEIDTDSDTQSSDNKKVARVLKYDDGDETTNADIYDAIVVISRTLDNIERRTRVEMNTISDRLEKIESKLAMITTSMAGSKTAATNLITEVNMAPLTKNVMHTVTALFADSLWINANRSSVHTRMIPIDYEYLKKLISNVSDDVSVNVRSKLSAHFVIILNAGRGDNLSAICKLMADSSIDHAGIMRSYILTAFSRLSNQFSFMIPQDVCRLMASLSFITSDGMPQTQDPATIKSIPRNTGSVYTKRELKTISSAPYMKCIHLYRTVSNKKVLLAICSSMMSNKISKTGDYNKAEMYKGETDPEDLFLSAAERAARDINKNANENRRTFASNSMLNTDSDSDDSEDMFSPIP